MSQKPFLRVKRALGGFVAPPVGLVKGGGGVEQGEVAKTRPKRGAQGAWPVSSGHGSCQGVWCGEGRGKGALCAMVVVGVRSWSPR